MQYVGRTKGETREHLYDDSTGYPIRVCNWTMPDNDFVEIGDYPMCRYCQAYQGGKRKICFAPTPNLNPNEGVVE